MGAGTIRASASWRQSVATVFLPWRRFACAMPRNANHEKHEFSRKNLKGCACIKSSVLSPVLHANGGSYVKKNFLAGPDILHGLKVRVLVIKIVALTNIYGPENVAIAMDDAIAIH